MEYRASLVAGRWIISTKVKDQEWGSLKITTTIWNITDLEGNNDEKSYNNV